MGWEYSILILLFGSVLSLLMSDSRVGNRFPQARDSGRTCVPWPPGQRSVEEALIGSPDPSPQEGDRWVYPATVTARGAAEGWHSHLPSKREQSHSGPHPMVFLVPWEPLWEGLAGGWQWSWGTNVWVPWVPLSSAQIRKTGSRLGHPTASHRKVIYQLKTCANRC